MPFFTDQRALHRSIGGKDHASILIAPILFDGENLNENFLFTRPAFDYLECYLWWTKLGTEKASVVKENFASQDLKKV